jgi:cytidine deaminase
MSDPAVDGVEPLLSAARLAIERAYAPYSGFRVGAALLADGRLVTGVNVENASYPLSMCAERVALGAMVDAGLRRLEAVAIVTAAARPTPPCGACRQALWEFGERAIVVSETTAGLRRTWALAELLPDAFGPANLDR